MARRSVGEGSVRRRGDGRWEARVEVGGRRLSRYGATRAEAVAKLRALQLAPPPSRTEPSLTLAAWAERWLASLDLRPSSRATYRAVLALPLSQLGEVRLVRLDAAQLSVAFAVLRERGRGARRLQLAHGYLASCLARAVALGHLSTNPMAGVPRPRWTPPEKRYWTLDETARFLLACRASPLRYAPLFALLLGTGLRLSEALALESSEAGAVLVGGGQVWTQATGYSAERPKTRAGARTVAVPEAAAWALSSLPFRTAGGQVPRPAILYATLAALCAEAAVPRVTPHALRHQHAALAYRATGDMYAVQHRLGHASVTTTMGLYGFGMREDHATAGALDGLMGGAPPGRSRGRAVP
jgi:integrase